MPCFQKIFDRFGVRTRSTQQPNPSNATSSKLSLAERLDRQRTSMSPNTRTKAWLDSQLPSKDDPQSRKRSKTPSVLGVAGGKISKRTNPKSNLRFEGEPKGKATLEKSVKFSNEPEKKHKRFSLWGALASFSYRTEDKAATLRNSNDSYEGSTLIADHSSVASSVALEEDTVVQDQEGDLHKADEHDFSDFTKEEHFLFNKLNARGFEPILNANWHWHFRTFPADLFTNDESKAYISHTDGPEFQAMKMLRLLVDAGLRVRECFQLNQEPEKPLHDAVQKYFKWTMQDAKLDKKDHIPILSITCAKKGELADSLIRRCTDRLHALGRQYRDMWHVEPSESKKNDEVQCYSHELPTIFGIVVIDSVVGFVTYDARYPGKAVRTMGNWDFSLQGQDVWHAFAVAIFMICARNYLMDLDDEGLLGSEVRGDDEDPDA